MPARDTDPKPASASPPTPVVPHAPPTQTPTPSESEAPSALDRQADRLADRADDAQAKADAAAAEAQAALEAAEDEDAPGTVRRCPHCRAPMEKHGTANPYTANCWHCNTCGCCFSPGLKHVRPGTGACALAAKLEAD